MSTEPVLLIDLTGVARLADVRRPVVSMWRSRFAASDDPFPASVAESHGRPQFDMHEVAEWLARTAKGNNADAWADAAAASVPAGFSFADSPAVAELEAIVALAAQVDGLEEMAFDAVREAAVQADPHDVLLRHEVLAHLQWGGPWFGFAQRLIDAAYSPAAALALIGRKHAALHRSVGSAGPLASEAQSLVAECAQALRGQSEAVVTVDAGDAQLSVNVAAAVGVDATLIVPAGVHSRQVRRRLLAEGHWVAEADAAAERAVVVARVPSGAGDDVATMLRAVDEIALGMRDGDAAVVIGPARALTDRVAAADELIRADILRTGRVRGIVRLGPALVQSAPRETLAMWMLGAPMGQVPIAERFTVVADLTDVPLTEAARADVVSDVVASMGGAREVRSHAFRFGRFARTATLLARGALVGTAPVLRSGVQVAEIPALIDAASDAVRGDLAPVPLQFGEYSVPRAASVAEMIAEGHLRVLPGVRLAPGLTGAEGFVVVAASDLDDPGGIGRVRVDQFDFAAKHPNAVLTRPGDVIFRTSPTAAAWVDVEGSKVVAYPARVLRVTDGDPGGLVPEVIAADISDVPGGPGVWKRWMLRRVAPAQGAPLRRAMAQIAAARSDLEARAVRMDHYAALIVAGATSGAVTMMESTEAAVAASEQ